MVLARNDLSEVESTLNGYFNNDVKNEIGSSRNMQEMIKASKGVSLGLVGKKVGTNSCSAYLFRKLL